MTLWWLPGAVRERVSALVHNRLAMKTSLGDVRLGLGSLSIADVELTAAVGDGLKVRISEVEVEANPFMAILRGTDAVQSIVISDVSVTLRSGSTGLRSVMKKLSGTKTGKAGQVSSSARRSVRVRGLTVKIEDAHGTLLALEGGEVHHQGAALSLDLSSLKLGGGPSSAIAMRDLTARLERREGSFVLREAALASAEIILEKHIPTPDDEEPQQAAGAVEVSSLAGRLRALLSGLAPEESKDAVSAKGPAGSPYRRLSPDVSITLQRASVRSANGAGGQRLLDDLEFTIKGESDNMLRISGRGEAHGGGILRWDMRLWPEALRADGNVDISSLPLSLVAPLLPELPWHEPENSRIDAQLFMQSESVDSIAVKGEVQLRDAAIYSPRVAPGPITDIQIGVKGQGHWLPLKRRLEIEQAGPAPEVVLEVTWGWYWRGDQMLRERSGVAIVPRCVI